MPKPQAKDQRPEVTIEMPTAIIAADTIWLEIKISGADAGARPGIGGC
jgi:hypothetical protein